MIVVSTNIGNATTIEWKGKKLQTGIYKSPVNNPIYLDNSDVINDQVIDRKYHGGSDKACYVFSEHHYAYWKKLYPKLEWNWGMFGENLSISNLDESQIFIGDSFKIGEAMVQVSQPRQPCFKLGIRFGSQKMVKQFIEYGYCGVYLRVLTKGYVKTGDKMELVGKIDESLSVKDVFRLIYEKEQDDKSNVLKALNIESLAQSCKKDLKQHWKI